MTYTVKINTYKKRATSNEDDPESDTRPEKLPSDILIELLSALVYLNNKENVQTHVLRKILSTLARYFTKFHDNWPEFIASVIATIVNNKPIADPSNLSIESLTQQLSERNTLLCLEFCQVLVEDVKSTTLEMWEEVKIDNILNKNISNLTILLRFASEILSPKAQSSNLILEHVFKTYGAWAVNHPMDTEYIKILSPVTTFIFQVLRQGATSELYLTALDEISEILNRFPLFFNKDVKAEFVYILNETGRPIVQQIEAKNAQIAQLSEVFIYDEDDDLESLERTVESFSKAAIVICEIAMGNIDSFQSVEISTLVEYLLIISNFPGFPYVDHNLTMSLLEFWGTYADTLLDNEGQMPQGSSTIIRIIEVFWNKSTLPVPAQKAHWTKDSWEGFDSFRKDFWEFLDATYVIVGTPLFQTLVNNILEQLNNGQNNWEKVEASLSCINALSENITPQSQVETQLISQLLQSPLLEQLSNLNNMYIKTTGVNFIGSYDSFFEESVGKPFLFPALDYLFKALSISNISTTASRSIQKLCSSCRGYLSNALSSFFDTYRNMSLYEVLNNISHERTVLAISFVIQAVTDLDVKAGYVNELINLILGQVEKVYTQYEARPPDSRDEEFKRICSLLKCLGNIGKGLQVPDEAEDIERGSDLNEISLTKQYWDEDKFGIRPKLLQVMRIFAIEREGFNTSVNVCENCCAILKSGFSENLPGPFVFPIDTVLEFIKAKYGVGPASCYSSLIDLSCCFVSSYSVGSSSIPADYLNSLLDTFFLDYNVMLDSEPDGQTGKLKLLKQIFTHYLSVLLNNPKLEVMIRFALEMLKSNDRFVMREATFFWTNLISTTGCENEEDERKIELILGEVGLKLTETILNEVSGACARSELEFYGEILKSLMAKRMNMARKWVEYVLVQQPSEEGNEGRIVGDGGARLRKLELGKRRMFYQQLVNLRGKRDTNKVVKQFWLAARGMESDYV